MNRYATTRLRTCALDCKTFSLMKSKQWKKKSNVACNLSINGEVADAIEDTIASKKKKRKGIKNRSELTERLWVGWLRRNGVKLPASCAALFKNGRAAA